MPSCVHVLHERCEKRRVHALPQPPCASGSVARRGAVEDVIAERRATLDLEQGQYPIHKGT